MSAARTAPPRLAALEVDMAFGGNNALENVTLELAAGAWHGLIGPNGSGKSTVLNVLSGVYLPTGGRVVHDGSDITRSKPRARARHGIVRSFQHPLLARSLSLADNVRLGLSARRGRNGIEVDDALEMLGIGDLAGQLPLEAPYGARKLAEIARACVAGPTVLLLDEPAAGLSAEERTELIEALRRIRRQLPDTAVCLVEHDVALVSAVTDTMTVLHSGKVLCSGDPGTVLADPRVAEVYLGTGGRRDADTTVPAGASAGSSTGTASGRTTTIEEML